jgi:hypothetical protein
MKPESPDSGVCYSVCCLLPHDIISYTSLHIRSIQSLTTLSGAEVCDEY